MSLIERAGPPVSGLWFFNRALRFYWRSGYTKPFFHVDRVQLFIGRLTIHWS